jgi:peroxiredoxin
VSIKDLGMNMKRITGIVVALMFLAGCINEKIEGADLKVGDVIPDFEVVMNDGSIVSDEILKESVSVIMFFHTSCPDCQQALPRMQHIYDEYAPKGVSFALISREDRAEDVEVYFNKKGLELPYSAQNDRKVYEMFAQSRIPRIYICEKGGIIRYIFTDDPVPSYDQLKSSIEDIIH